VAFRVEIIALCVRLALCACNQGESNTDTFQGTLAGPANYACRIRAAVQDWREKFKSPMLPFFNIELAACSNYPDRADNAITWASIRQASRSFLSLPGTTGFVTTIDLGMANGAVHSTVKQPDGRRLALQVLREVYGDPVTAAGPSLTYHKPPNGTDDTKHMLVLGVSLLCWGCWPTLRQLCGAPIAAFATLNICSQCATSFVYLFALSTAGTIPKIHKVLHDPTSRELCVFLGEINANCI
jgi:hypothetical protein